MQFWKKNVVFLVLKFSIFLILLWGIFDACCRLGPVPCATKLYDRYSKISYAGIESRNKNIETKSSLDMFAALKFHIWCVLFFFYPFINAKYQFWFYYSIFSKFWGEGEDLSIGAFVIVVEKLCILVSPSKLNILRYQFWEKAKWAFE